jgi:hypothetical protein
MGSNPILDIIFLFFLVNCLGNKEGVEAECYRHHVPARQALRFLAEQWAA